MSKNKLLVSLVSDQTLPNVQLIKEFGDEDTEYLFVSTTDMEKKGCRQWIETCCGIGTSLKIVITNQFSYEEVQQKLADIDYDSYYKITVNITGGTKIMSVAASDFFKEIGAEIFYVTGINQEYIRTYPKRKTMDFRLKESITLSEYLYSYGFEYKPTAPSGIPFEQSEKIFQNFAKVKIEDFANEFEVLQKKRGKPLKTNDFPKAERFLSAIGYTPIVPGELNAIETKYLTGEWFEEYIGQRIKNELDLRDTDILIGAVITKNASIQQNSSEKLLDIESDTKVGNVNEMDVMFMYQNQFYAIECKSSIIGSIEVKNDENNDQISLSKKQFNILGETIYKLDSLKSRFGLFAKASIVTMTNFKEYIDDSDKNRRDTKTRSMKSLIERADLSRIKITDGSMLVSTEKIIDLIK